MAHVGQELALGPATLLGRSSLALSLVQIDQSFRSSAFQFSELRLLCSKQCVFGGQSCGHLADFNSVKWFFQN